ncbi:FtsX-like permease family protein [Thermoactinomyces sp. DSM 45892]|uniref:FtsX-like permease family protein n=1 Tax=Thermoactinomyces sp. DSM 45892 TaxID=1882753 RepID=UPI00089CC51C|nr:ABC transporter permease [Thermoactinomyces sp. DSM 45892]SDY24578.1 putative ABC transport system permease protein [Thermoactinomyces sp. DSM 45892]
MTFWQFAYRNVSRNIRNYLAFFFSSAFSVMIFFSYAAFIFHPRITQDETIGNTVQIGMIVAEFIIYFFSFLFVIYSVGNFLKIRSKEFGLLTLMGAPSYKLSRLVFLENIIIGTLSIGTGILAGLLFMQLFFLGATNIIDMPPLPFYFPVTAFQVTAGAFFLLFLIVSFFTRFMIRKNSILTLIQGSVKPKKEPRISIFLALLSAGTICSALFLASFGINTISIVLTPLLLIIGTYFLFSQLSVVIIRLLKQKRSFFWRGTKLLWLSDLSYRIKDNARLFFLVTIVSTVAFTSAGGFLAIKEFIIDSLDSSFHFQVTPFEDKNGKKESTLDKRVGEELKNAGVSYLKMTTTILTIRDRQLDKTYDFMKLSEYENWAKRNGIENIPTLKSSEVILLTTSRMEEEALSPSSMQVGKKKFHIQERKMLPKKDHVRPQIPYEFVINDTDYNELLVSSKENKTYLTEETLHNYFVSSWNDDIPKRDSTEVKIGQKLQQEAKGINEHFIARGAQLVQAKQVFDVMMFIGIFIAMIFFLAAASFLYFRLYADLEEDQRKYYAISKIGLTLSELRSTITIQIAVLFFLPFFVSVLYSGFSILVISRQLGVNPFVVFSGIGMFFIFQLVYFFFANSRYMKHMKRHIV